MKRWNTAVVWDTVRCTNTHILTWLRYENIQKSSYDPQTQLKISNYFSLTNNVTEFKRAAMLSWSSCLCETETLSSGRIGAVQDVSKSTWARLQLDTSTTQSRNHSHRFANGSKHTRSLMCTLQTAVNEWRSKCSAFIIYFCWQTINEILSPSESAKL